jgi:Protein of unknown function (DUF3572)
MRLRLKTSHNLQDNSSISLEFMSYLASDQERLQAFCGLTGFGEKDLVENLQQPAFQGFLLDFALQDESLLLAFCADKGFAPETVVAARRKLPGLSE